MHYHTISVSIAKILFNMKVYWDLMLIPLNSPYLPLPQGLDIGK